MIGWLAGCCLVAACVPAGAQDASEADGVVSGAEAISKLASDQEKVRAEMAGLVQNFRAMVADMLSNGNMPEKKAEEIRRLVDGITLTDANHVRKAAELLRQAYAQERANETAARKDSLGAAGTEVQNALDKLNALLRMANALRAGEIINVDLEAIIRAQDSLIADSKRIGKEILAGQEKLSLEPAKIAADQDKLAGRTSNMQELVRVALAEDVGEGVERLNRAMAFLDEEKIDARMQMASRNIEQRDVLASLPEQQEALLALTRLAKILGQDDPTALRDLAKEAEKMLANERKLRRGVEKMAEGEFKDKAAEKNIDQKDIQKQAEEIAKELANREASEPKPAAPDSKNPAEKKPNSPAGNEAKKADAKAAAAASKKGGGNKPTAGGGPGTPQEQPPSPGGNKSDKKPGSPSEAAKEAGERMGESSEELTKRNKSGATEKMKAAEAATRKLINHLKEEVVLFDFPAIRPELAKEIAGVQGAIDDMKEGETPEKGMPMTPAAAQKMLEELLAAAAAEAQAVAMSEAQKGGGKGERSSEGAGEGNKDKEGKGEGKSEEGKGQGSVPSKDPGPSAPKNDKNKPQPTFGMTPMAGQRPGGLGNISPFTKGADLLYGARDNKDTTLTSSLGKRDQMALEENFAQELPREYREMLKAYYDKLSHK